MKCLNCNKSISLSIKVAYLLLGKKAQTCSSECEKILDLQFLLPQEELQSTFETRAISSVEFCLRCSRKLPRNRKEYCCWKCRYPDSNHAISKAKRYCQTRTCSTVIPMDATYVYCRACETKREKKRKKNKKDSALKSLKPRNSRDKKSSPLVKVPLKKEKCLHVKKLKFDLPANVHDWSKWPTEKKLKSVSKEFQESIWSR